MTSNPTLNETRRHPDSDQQERLPALDGVRGVAILVVMLAHFTILDSGSAVDVVVGTLWRAGWVGVDLFFVLSGFLITGILYDSRHGPGYFRNFYARRTLRIFPLYYAVLLITYLVVPFTTAARIFPPPEAPAAAYFLYLSNFAVAFTGDIGHEILSVTWSLAIEEQFYLVWPLVVLLLRRRALMGLCVALVVVSLGCRGVLVARGADWTWPFAITFCRMDGLAAGAFVALWTRGGACDSRARRIAWMIALLMLIGVLAIIALKRKVLWHGGVEQVVGYTLVALLFASVLFNVIQAPPGSPLPRALSQAWLVMLGKYSYALYLFHVPARAIAREYLYPIDEPLRIAGSALPGQLIYAALSFALAMAAALLSWHLLETRFLSLKRHFPVPKRPTTATAWQGADVVARE